LAGSENKGGPATTKNNVRNPKTQFNGANRPAT
jgi:hypothetical protein